MRIGHFRREAPTPALSCAAWGLVGEVCVRDSHVQHPGLPLMSFSVDGDLADGWCRCWAWAVGVQDETKHLLGPSDPHQAPVEAVAKRKDDSLWKT